VHAWLNTVGKAPRVALGYAITLLGTSIWLETSSGHYEHHVLQQMSTDVWHLSHDPWLVLPASAFFTTGGLLYAIAAAIVCMGLLEREAGLLVTLLVAVSAHLIGTGVSEGVQAIRVSLHDLPPSARHAIDVGPSYVLVACATCVIAWQRAWHWSRVICAVGLVPIFVFTAWRIPNGDVDAVGHLTAACVGAVWGWALTRRGVGPRRSGLTASLR
jgi:membrane associated rhomboid family serine protease